jgi:hypothetical protein
MKAALALLLLPLWPLRWLVRQLRRDLRLRIEGRRLRLVLEDSAAPADSVVHAAPPAVAAAPATLPARDEGPSQMQQELNRLLGQHRQARHLMRHLGYVERSLALAGPDALDALPLDVLTKASQQLQQLVADWSAPGLAELRLRLAMAVSDKEEAEKRFEPTNSALSDFNTPQRLEVSEGSPSDFRAVDQDWKKT